MCCKDIKEKDGIFHGGNADIAFLKQWENRSRNGLKKAVMTWLLSG